MKKQTSATTATLDKNRVVVDYTGKTIFVGIDVHQKSYQIAKLYNGITLGNHCMNASSSGLIEHLKSHYPGAAFKCVYEACSWGFNLYRDLTAAGIDCIVVNAVDVATSDKERKRKTDKVDAVKLAKAHAAGDLKAIHVPPVDLEKQRSLIRYRKMVVSDLGRTKNRLKCFLKLYNIAIPDKYVKNNWSNNFIDWIKQQAAKDSLLAATLLLMVEQIVLLRKLLLSVQAKLRTLQKQTFAAETKLLMSVPGIGATTAMLLVLEIGDVRRFKGFDSLNDFVGFCPDTCSSGESNRDTGITARRHKQLRTALVEAAWIAIKNDPALMDSYETLKKRMLGTRAIIRIARKLLRRIRAVMISAAPYQKGIVVG
jgi:transposase